MTQTQTLELLQLNITLSIYCTWHRM